MSRHEGSMLFGIREQRRQHELLVGMAVERASALLELGQRNRRRIQRRLARSHGRIQVRVGRLEPRDLVQAERMAESDHERRDMLERTTQEHDVSPDGTPARETTERLADYGLQGALRDVGLSCTRIDQRSDIGLREHGAAGNLAARITPG